jgi:hypothetical protein
MVTCFQSMLACLGFDALPAYYSKVVYRADARHEWCTTVHVFDGELLYHKISGTSYRSMCGDAKADAAWPSPPSATLLKISCRTLLSATTRVAL